MNYDKRLIEWLRREGGCIILQPDGNSLAAALEELAILKNADVGMMWAQMQEDLRDFDAMKARAERAEAELAEQRRLRNAAEYRAKYTPQAQDWKAAAEAMEARAERAESALADAKQESSAMRMDLERLLQGSYRTLDPQWQPIADRLAALADAERRGREQGMRDAANLCDEAKERWAQMGGDYSHSESGCYECGREDQCRTLARAILAAIGEGK